MHTELADTDPPGYRFAAGFAEDFEALLRWRRDVRRFSREPIDEALIEHLLDLACLAPSVGNAQPWRFVSVDRPGNRDAVAGNFALANAQALAGYSGPRAQLYAQLKLAGLREAPRQFAVFCDEGTPQGNGLGRVTMPEMLKYSVALSVHTFWLAARAAGIGLGWVSILDPVNVVKQLRVPADWSLVAYLCVGYPIDESTVPELERVGWQSRDSQCRKVLKR
ncbi:MAG TPA: 5,6-dimethylbenzimidazole synthase [Micromonosporaceae bacterium]|nr:5,6-dimethylbenzimidazole synthase [Micromonosporaceae bacterium]HCU52643.1 5,6-dimethylbenzimidazole synthase [Micromonosporaceae bacterium]